MKPAIIYSLLSIQAVVLSAFIWVIDGRAEARSDTQRAENIIKITDVKTSLNDIGHRMETIEDRLDDVSIVWTLEDVIQVVQASDEDMKRYIKIQNKKMIADEKKKYDTFYLEHEGKLYKVYAIETEEDEWTVMKTVEVENLNTEY